MGHGQRKKWRASAYLQVKFGGTLQITKLLQRVTQIAVSFSKVGIHENALLVVEYAFGEIAKLEVNCSQ